MAKKKVFQISNSLGDGLEETISAAHNYSGDLRVEVIPLKKIEVDPENPRDLSLTFLDIYNNISRSDAEYERKTKELASLQSLAHSIKEQGIINPIVVYKFGEKYRLVAGERRTLASIIANKSDIQAKILDSKPNSLKISILQWIENIERSDLSLWERIRNLEKMVSAYANQKNISVSDITVTTLSNLIGCTKSHAISYKSVLNSDEQLKQLILENKIKNLEKAAFISNIKDEETKQNIIFACLSGVPLKKLKTMAEQNRVTIIPKSQEKRGRQTSSVNLGATKNLNVAKIILSSILSNDSLAHLTDSFKNVNWSDFRSVNGTFKELLKKLEELHA